MNRSIKRACRPMCEGLEGWQLLSGSYIVNAASGVTAGATGATLSQTAALRTQLDRLGLNDLRFLGELVLNQA